MNRIVNTFGKQFNFLGQWQWERDVAIKRLNFRDTRRRISVPLAISTKLHTKKSKLEKKKKKNLVKCWGGQDRPEKNSAICLIRSGEIQCPGQTWTKPTIASWNLNGTRSLGAPTHDGRWYVAGAGQVSHKNLVAGVEKTNDQKSRSLSDGKNRPFSGLNE